MPAATAPAAAAAGTMAAAGTVGGGYEDEHSELLAACEAELRDVVLRERRVEGELTEAMDSLLRLEGTGAEAVTVRGRLGGGLCVEFDGAWLVEFSNSGP